MQPSDIDCFREKPLKKVAFLEVIRKKLPPRMRLQLCDDNLAEAYCLLSLLSDDKAILDLRQFLERHYGPSLTNQPLLAQALELINTLKRDVCNTNPAFKFRLPSYIGEYPVHSRPINRKINLFNTYIEDYYATGNYNDAGLSTAYQAILDKLTQHYMGSNLHCLWQLLRALCAWSTIPLAKLFSDYSYLLSASVEPQNAPISESEVIIEKSIASVEHTANNKPAISPMVTPTFDYSVNSTGRLAPTSTYLSIHGFALKPGGHADALEKRIPAFLTWTQWQSYLRRQLSQLVNCPLDELFFDTMQCVLQQLGVDFVPLNTASFECHVSPFLNHESIVSSLNEEIIIGILDEKYQQSDRSLTANQLHIISRFLLRLLPRFQFNRAEALGIGANWGGVVSDANEDGVDAYRLNDEKWASTFRYLSKHRQGPAEARMNATIGVKYELYALLSNFKFMTQLQPTEYGEVLFNAINDHLIARLFPDPRYFENHAYVKYRQHFVVSHNADQAPKIHSFYLADSQGTYFKSRQGDYKQTPLFREAGSLLVVPFPRDTGSGDCFQSLSVANPLWPLQGQYARCGVTGVRGHLVYNPIGPNEFLPDSYYGQLIREDENDEVYIPFIGVVPKNFDKQEELCASFVIRMLQSSRLITHCPVFKRYCEAIAAQFLPQKGNQVPLLPSSVNPELLRKQKRLADALSDNIRTAKHCTNAFFSLFKELIYSLYSFSKDETDFHFYFMELITSSEAFKPKTRSTCERIIRELITLKPTQSLQALQYHEVLVAYLRQLTEFFYPTPCDAVAKDFAEVAKLHIKPLMSRIEIKNYFADLTKESSEANISRKLSPGLMNDVLKNRGPSLNVFDDYYNQRHKTNFYSGYRDLDGNVLILPSTRESRLDMLIKMVGALVPLVYRNKTVLSLLTQPCAQAFIAGYQQYHLTDRYKILNAIVFSAGGFAYGTGLGAFHAMSSFPRTVYYALQKTNPSVKKPNHVLAISSAPSSVSGLRVKAIMSIRDQLIEQLAHNCNYVQSRAQLVDSVIHYVKEIHPALLTGRVSKEAHYKKILLELFPLDDGEWQQLHEPIIKTNDPNLEKMIDPLISQIDYVLVNAVYECLTTPNCSDAPTAVIEKIIEKNKLRAPQDKILAILVDYYITHPQTLKLDLPQYRFHGQALALLKKKERGLKQIQAWVNNALNYHWASEALFNILSHRLNLLLNQLTLADIILEFPESLKEILQDLIANPNNASFILRDYHLSTSQETFLLRCFYCYESIKCATTKSIIVERLNKKLISDTVLNSKTREHNKLIEYIKREWQHQPLNLESAKAIIKAIKFNLPIAKHATVDHVWRLYEEFINNSHNIATFDTFYKVARLLINTTPKLTMLKDWINVTANTVTNQLLDEIEPDGVQNAVNPLLQSKAIMHWLKIQLYSIAGLKPLLTQQIEQSSSLDTSAARCQIILNAAEKLIPDGSYLHKTGMQKLLRVICQNNNTLTVQGMQQARTVPIAALCKYSVTMQHALTRVTAKTPAEDRVRPIYLEGKTLLFRL